MENCTSIKYWLFEFKSTKKTPKTKPTKIVSLANEINESKSWLFNSKRVVGKTINVAPVVDKNLKLFPVVYFLQLLL